MSKRSQVRPGDNDAVVLPVVRETLRIGKRRRDRVVRVEITPRRRKETVEVPVVEEQAVVERVPINRVVDKVEPVRHEGRTTIVPVYEEVVVVERRLVLKEEIRITRQKQTRHERRQVELRSEEVRVSRP